MQKVVTLSRSTTEHVLLAVAEWQRVRIGLRKPTVSDLHVCAGNGLGAEMVFLHPQRMKAATKEKQIHSDSLTWKWKTHCFFVEESSLPRGHFPLPC